MSGIIYYQPNFTSPFASYKGDDEGGAAAALVLLLTKS